MIKKGLLSVFALAFPLILVLGSNLSACNHDEELKEKTRKIQVHQQQQDQQVLSAVRKELSNDSPEVKTNNQTPSSEKQLPANKTFALNQTGILGGAGFLMLIGGLVLVIARRK